MKTTFQGQRSAGLSLIRSLTIIALIVLILVVIGLFISPFGGPREMSPKVAARDDEMQIVNAVKNYIVEYQKYPIDKVHGAVVFSADNNLLIDVLRNFTGAKEGNPLNPRDVLFLDVPTAKDQDHPKSGIQISTGIWYDPWGSPYHIAIDCDNSGELNGKVPISGFYSDVGPLKANVIVWSLGKNGELGGGPAKKPGFSDENGTPGKFSGSGDVVSW